MYQDEKRQSIDYIEKASFDSFASSFDSRPEHTAKRLKVNYKDWRARHGKITDADTGELLFTSEHRYRKPTFALHSPDGQQIGTACSHKVTNKMDMQVRGQDFPLEPARKFGCTSSYSSPAYGGRTLTWKSAHSWGCLKYICLDNEAQPVARFKGGSSWKCMPWGSFGEFEFAHGREATAAQVEEVVATGLTLVYRAAMNHTAALGAAGNTSTIVAIT